MYKYKTRVRIYDADAAGVLFFGSQFRLIHDSYEGLLNKAGYGIKRILGDAFFTLPVVHAESDYLQPLRAGDEIEIMINLENIGSSSFILNYEIYRNGTELAGKAKTVHVAVDKTTGKKIKAPEEFIAALRAAF